jgi:hypothetical protein
MNEHNNPLASGTRTLEYKIERLAAPAPMPTSMDKTPANMILRMLAISSGVRLR